MRTEKRRDGRGGQGKYLRRKTFRKIIWYETKIPLP